MGVYLQRYSEDWEKNKTFFIHQKREQVGIKRDTAVCYTKFQSKQKALFTTPFRLPRNFCLLIFFAPPGPVRKA